MSNPLEKRPEASKPQYGSREDIPQAQEAFRNGLATLRQTLTEIPDSYLQEHFGHAAATEENSVTVESVPLPPEMYAMNDAERIELLREGNSTVRESDEFKAIKAKVDALGAGTLHAFIAVENHSGVGYRPMLVLELQVSEMTDGEQRLRSGAF